MRQIRPARFRSTSEGSQHEDEELQGTFHSKKSKQIQYLKLTFIPIGIFVNSNRCLESFHGIWFSSVARIIRQEWLLGTCNDSLSYTMKLGLCFDQECDCPK